MQTLETLQRAIDTSRQLKDIVRTMKVLAAVSIRQYERAALSLAEYSDTVEMGLQVLVRHIALPSQRSKSGANAAIVFGSDQGLCGRFNELLLEFVHGRLEQTENTRLLAVGARVDMGLEALGFQVEECFFVPGSVAGITLTVQQILQKIESWQAEGVNEVKLYYHKHSGRGRYRPIQQVLLPLDEHYFKRLQKKTWQGRTLPAYSMNPSALFAALVRQHLFISLYRACAESLASEHGQRLISMQLAEKNIGQRLQQLTMTYQQQRQETITAEVLEVVSGFEALQDEVPARERI